MKKKLSQKAMRNIGLTYDTIDRIRRLEIRLEAASASEVIRRTLIIVDELLSKVDKGATLILRKEDGSQEVVRFL